MNREKYKKINKTENIQERKLIKQIDISLKD